MHPLIANFEKLKDAEIEQAIQNLTKKYFMTRNPEVQQQIVLLLDSYKSELGSRRAKQLQAEYQKRDKDLDKLIKVD